MASTENDVADEESSVTEPKRRFVSTPISDRDADGGESDEKDSAEAGPLMSRRAAISGVAMGAAALMCFVLAAGFSGGQAQVSDETAQQVFTLREQIKTAETQADKLPEANDAERALVTALEAANEVADLQNGHRHLTPQVAAAGGELPMDAASAIQRNLTPYFAQSVDMDQLLPWYLLTSDKDVPSGNGLPMSFDSGFEWVAQRPYSVTVDSTVRVIWLAVETRPAEGQRPAVLAWAQADYDLTRKTFFEIRTGTTATGEALRQEVKAQ